MRIFPVNNSGHTFAQLIHGPESEYNAVAPWQFLEAPSFFGASTDGSYRVETHRVRIWDELETVLKSKEVQDGKGLKMVEVPMDKNDMNERS